MSGETTLLAGLIRLIFYCMGFVLFGLKCCHLQQAVPIVSCVTLFNVTENP